MQSACAILHCHLCPVCLYYIFPHYLINGTIFWGEKHIEHKILVFDFLYNLYLKQYSFLEEFSEMCVRLRIKYLLFLSDFNETWNFLDRFLEKNLRYQILSKSVRWETSVSMWMDMMDLIAALYSFSNAFKNQVYINKSIQYIVCILC